MSQVVTCPLCTGTETTVLDKAEISAIVSLYERYHACNIKPLFQGNEGCIELHLCRACGLKFYSPMIAGDEAFYAHLAAHHEWYYRDEKWEFTLTRNSIPKEAHVLEVGCGKGAFSTGLTCASYTGLEFSDSQLPSNDSWRTFLKKSAEEHAQSHVDAYDVVCSFQVLEHVTELRAFVDALAKMLKPGGLMVLSAPCEDSHIGTRVNESLNMPPHHMTRWTGTAFASLGKIMGLELINLVKEPLQNPNIVASSLIAGILRAYTGLPAAPLVDLSYRHLGLLESAGNLLSRMPDLVQNITRGQAQHSYLAAYRKRTS